MNFNSYNNSSKIGGMINRKVKILTHDTQNLNPYMKTSHFAIKNTMFSFKLKLATVRLQDIETFVAKDNFE